MSLSNSTSCFAAASSRFGSFRSARFERPVRSTTLRRDRAQQTLPSSAANSLWMACPTSGEVSPGPNAPTPVDPLEYFVSTRLHGRPHEDCNGRCLRGADGGAGVFPSCPDFKSPCPKPFDVGEWCGDTRCELDGQPIQCQAFSGCRLKRGKRLSVPIADFRSSLAAVDLKVELHDGCGGPPRFANPARDRAGRSSRNPFKARICN